MCSDSLSDWRIEKPLPAIQLDQLTIQRSNLISKKTNVKEDRSKINWILETVSTPHAILHKESYLQWFEAAQWRAITPDAAPLKTLNAFNDSEQFYVLYQFITPLEPVLTLDAVTEQTQAHAWTGLAMTEQTALNIIDETIESFIHLSGKKRTVNAYISFKNFLQGAYFYKDNEAIQLAWASPHFGITENDPLRSFKTMKTLLGQLSWYLLTGQLRENHLFQSLNQSRPGLQSRISEWLVNLGNTNSTADIKKIYEQFKQCSQIQKEEVISKIYRPL